MSGRARSLRTYTLLMLGVSVVVLAALSWRMLDRLHVIERTQIQEENAAAQLEFERAVDNTLAQVSLRRRGCGLGMCVVWSSMIVRALCCRAIMRICLITCP